MESNEMDTPESRFDRTALTVANLHDADDKEFWWSKTPMERLAALEINRRTV